MCDGSECYFESVALYSHNGKDGEDVDTCLLSSILVGTCVCLVNFLSVWVIAVKHCDGLGGILSRVSCVCMFGSRVCLYLLLGV